MKEYFGKSAKKYSQAVGNLIILNPALEKEIHKAVDKEAKFLDVGCGNGVFSEVALQKGYKYYGIDISSDMIELAKEQYPQGNYQVCKASNISDSFEDKFFDVILINMVFPAISSLDSIQKILENCKRCLKDSGTIIIGLAHPCYNPYMQKGLLNRTDVSTEFKTYFDSGVNYKIAKDIKNQQFTFSDYHWTLQDYINTSVKSGLYVHRVNECKPDVTKKEINPEYYEAKKKFPTFLIMSLKKLTETD